MSIISINASRNWVSDKYSQAKQTCKAYTPYAAAAAGTAIIAPSLFSGAVISVLATGVQKASHALKVDTLAKRHLGFIAEYAKEKVNGLIRSQLSHRLAASIGGQNETFENKITDFFSAGLNPFHSPERAGKVAAVGVAIAAFSMVAGVSAFGAIGLASSYLYFQGVAWVASKIAKVAGIVQPIESPKDAQPSESLKTQE